MKKVAVGRTILPGQRQRREMGFGPVEPHGTELSKSSQRESNVSWNYRLWNWNQLYPSFHAIDNYTVWTFQSLKPHMALMKRTKFYSERTLSRQPGEQLSFYCQMFIWQLQYRAHEPLGEMIIAIRYTACGIHKYALQHSACVAGGSECLDT